MFNFVFTTVEEGNLIIKMWGTTTQPISEGWEAKLIGAQMMIIEGVGSSNIWPWNCMSGAKDMGHAHMVFLLQNISLDCRCWWIIIYFLFLWWYTSSKWSWDFVSSIIYTKMHNYQPLLRHPCCSWSWWAFFGMQINGSNYQKIPLTIVLLSIITHGIPQ